MLVTGYYLYQAFSTASVKLNMMILIATMIFDLIWMPIASATIIEVVDLYTKNCNK